MSLADAAAGSQVRSFWFWEYSEFHMAWQCLRG